VLFFDSVPGGVNVINGANLPPVDPSPFPPDPTMFQKMNGTTFDAGFNADYVLVLRNGFTGFENRFDVNYAVMNAGPGGGSSEYLGVFNPTLSFSGSTPTGAANAAPINVGFNNSNILGVSGGTGTADQTAAALVSTGVEVELSLADLGNPAAGLQIKVLAFINNSNHDFVSNQFLAPIGPGSINLGSDSLGNFIPGQTFFDLSDFAGDQFFVISVVPEASAALLTAGPLAALGLVGCASRLWAKRRG
jgi:hypothetical protein